MSKVTDKARLGLEARVRVRPDLKARGGAGAGGPGELPPPAATLFYKQASAQILSEQVSSMRLKGLERDATCLRSHSRPGLWCRPISWTAFSFLPLAASPPSSLGCLVLCPSTPPPLPSPISSPPEGLSQVWGPQERRAGRAFELGAPKGRATPLPLSRALSGEGGQLWAEQGWTWRVLRVSGHCWAPGNLPSKLQDPLLTRLSGPGARCSVERLLRAASFP